MKNDLLDIHCQLLIVSLSGGNPSSPLTLGVILQALLSDAGCQGAAFFTINNIFEPSLGSSGSPYARKQLYQEYRRHHMNAKDKGIPAKGVLPPRALKAGLIHL